MKPLLTINNLQEGEGTRMRRKLSKKQIGVMGLAAMMAVQTLAMAAEVQTSPEATVQETQEETQPVESTSEVEPETQKQVEEQLDTNVYVEEPISSKMTEIETVEEMTEEVTEESVAESSETETSSEQVVMEYAAEDQEILTDGWHIDVNGDTIYIRDGDRVRDEIIFVEGKYYGLDEEGRLYKNSNFYHTDGFCYRASSDGSLYINQWYSLNHSSSKKIYYYYDAEGRECSGLCTIDGIQYYFDPNGNYGLGGLTISSVVTSDQGIYYCDAEGHAHLMQDNQWYEGDDACRYYVQNGVLLKNGTFQIDGKWYKFDKDGKLVQKVENVQEDGSLKINQWGYDGKHWHYYGADGASYTGGLHEINGVTYYFSWSGILATSTVCFKNGGTEYYIADENGYLKKGLETGWMFAGGHYYYAENGHLIYSEIHKVGDYYYGFNEDGQMYADTDFTITGWNGDRFVINYYHAKKDGSVDVPKPSQWYRVRNSWYYYDENGKYVTGKVEINGKTYVFDEYGELTSGGIYSEDGNDYLVNENGELVTTSGWKLVNSKWYYLNDDGTVYKGILGDNGHAYYMNPQMETNLSVVFIDGVGYSIDGNGYMTQLAEGIYEQDGERYYVSSRYDGIGVGWKYIDGSWYYIDSQGEAYCDTIRKIGDKCYFFDLEGKMKNSGWIFDEAGQWYYAYPSGELAVGDQTINGTLCHFGQTGSLKTGAVVEDGILKLYSDDGSLLETGTANGWNFLGGNYYYMRNGSLLNASSSYIPNCYQLPDGNFYAFDMDGKMQVNREINGVWYGESGAARRGWFQRGQNWCYADTLTGVLYKGTHWIDGKKYYFDDNGNMLIGKAVVDGKLVETDGSGAIAVNTSLEDGWSYHNGEWYYSKNGTPYTGWVGDYYIDFGHMVRNSIIMQYQYKNTYSSYEEEVYYYLDENGICKKNGWFTGRDSDGLEGECYANEDGSLACRGFFEIDGNQYYFGSSSFPYWQPYFKRTTRALEKGVFTEDGVYIQPNQYGQGWSLIEGKWLYKDGAAFVCGKEMLINGAYYYFDEHGAMTTGFPHDYTDFDTGWTGSGYQGRYYGTDGKRCYYTGWKFIDGKWYYFDSNSVAITGWAMIGGAKYYFGPTYGDDAAMTIGYRVIGGKLYYFNGSGACQGVCGPQTGWYQANGNWYYMRGGSVVTGKTVINNVEYDFDDKGIWID